MIRSAIVVLALVLGAAPALAAPCPPPVAGDTAAEIAQNQRRIICLQNQANTSADRLRQQQQIDMLDSRLQQLELQQRMNSIEIVTPPPVVIPDFNR